jgi:hypothetical protein
MNPEAGLIHGPFRNEVERIARAHPLMPSADVHRAARSALGESAATASGSEIVPMFPPAQAPTTATNLELQF